MNIAVGNYRKHGNVDKGEDFRKEIEWTTSPWSSPAQAGSGYYTRAFQ
jgi:hypothetical protein